MTLRISYILYGKKSRVKSSKYIGRSQKCFHSISFHLGQNNIHALLTKLSRISRYCGRVNAMYWSYVYGWFFWCIFLQWPSFLFPGLTVNFAFWKRWTAHTNCYLVALRVILSTTVPTHFTWFSSGHNDSSQTSLLYFVNRSFQKPTLFLEEASQIFSCANIADF